MKDDLVDEAISVLSEVREKLHNNVENSVIEELDEVIDTLRMANEHDNDSLSSDEVLILLGRLLNKLPQVVQLLNYLLD